MRRSGVCTGKLFLSRSLMLCALIALALSGGCSRAKDGSDEERPPLASSPQDVEVPDEVLPVQPVAPFVPDSLAGEPAVDPEASVTTADAPLRVSAGNLPFRICALFPASGGAARAGLVSRSDGAFGIITVGDSFLGYEAVEIDYESEDIIFRHGTDYLIAGLSGLEGVAGGAALVTGAQGMENASVVGKAEMPRFKPIPEEDAAGIDPNDSSTWPEDYRGPAIERMLRGIKDDPGLSTKEVPEEDIAARVKHGLEAPEVPSPAISTEQGALPDAVDLGFEATESERARGIDPNDPATWPDDYMGPGIERAPKTSDGR